MAETENETEFSILGCYKGGGESYPQPQRVRPGSRLLEMVN